MYRITIHREQAFAGAAQIFSVSIDGVACGSLPNGGDLTIFAQNPGIHTLAFSAIGFKDTFLQIFVPEEIETTIVNVWAKPTAIVAVQQGAMPGQIGASPVIANTRKNSGILSKIGIGVLALISIIILSAGYAALQSNRTEKNNEEIIATPGLTPEELRLEYTSSCSEVPYKSIARDPDNYKGVPVVFSGKVIQVSEGLGNSVTYRIVTSGNYDDIIYVTYTRKDGEIRILEDDIITIYGECRGVTSYTSVLGGTITIPSVKMIYFEIKNDIQEET